MLASSRNIVALILVGSAFALAPAAAQDIVVKAPPTFRDLEYDYSGGDRLAAATASLNARIPAGTEVAAARAIVREGGAHCGAAVQDGQTRCTFTSFESVEDNLHDVVWTVRLNSLNGKIATLDVARKSVGS